jgi:hypothetical protein
MKHQILRNQSSQILRISWKIQTPSESHEFLLTKLKGSFEEQSKILSILKNEFDSTCL